MAFFVLRQFVVLLLFSLTISLFLESARAKAIHLSRYLDNLDKEQFNDQGLISSDYSKPDLRTNPNNLEQSRRTISHQSSENRRFLFPPLFQTSVTSLNENPKSKANQHNGVGNSKQNDKNQILGYLNSKTGTVEYDVRGQVNKICFRFD